MMRYFLISFLFVWNIFLVHAQTPVQIVRGRVTDADTKAGLPGANIVILDSDPLLGTSSNADGTFSIGSVPVGRHTIQIRFMGYKPSSMPEILVTSGKEVILNVELEAFVVNTGEVEVKASMDKDKPVNPMAIISSRSFNVEESRRYAGSVDDPMRAVSNFAGVVGNNGINSNQIMIRGNSPKGLLWRVEGMDIPNPNHFSFVGTSGGGFTIFSSQVLSNSDFYTAAFPAQFGNALSGVFDMRFRNGNNARYEYAFQLGVQGIDFAAEGPFSKKNTSSYLVNYRYSILAFLQYIDPSMKNEIPEFQDVSFKINLPTRKSGTFALIGIGGISWIKDTPVQDSTKWKNLDDRSRSSLKNKMGAIALTHVIYLSRHTYLRSCLSNTYNDISADDSHMISGYKLQPEDSIIHQNIRASGSVSIHNKFGSHYSLLSGITYNRMFYNLMIKSRNPFTGIFQQVNKGSGNTGLIQAFSESKIDITNNLSLNPGLCFQYLLLNGHYSLEPRLGIRWQISGRHALSAGYGMHSQSEDIGLYLSQASTDGITMVQPNKNLNFSHAHHFVLGYDYLIRSDIRLKIETYYQYLYDIPVKPGSYFSLINSTGDYSNDTLVNSGTGRNEGIDMTFEKFLTHQYYTLITVSLIESKYRGGDGILRNTRFNSHFVINMLGGKEWTIRKKNIFGLNLKASLTGGEFYVPVDLQQSIQQQREILDEKNAYSQQLPAFFYFDLTLTYRTNHRKFSGIWAVQVKNLLNQKPCTGYVYDNFNASVEQQRALGIIPLISYKVEF